MNRFIPSPGRIETDRDELIVEEAVAGPSAVNSATPMVVSRLDTALTADMSAVSRIDAVASILEVVCRTTGMGFRGRGQSYERPLGRLRGSRRNRLRARARRRTGRQNDDLRRDS